MCLCLFIFVHKLKQVFKTQENTSTHFNTHQRNSILSVHGTSGKLPHMLVGKGEWKRKVHFGVSMEIILTSQTPLEEFWGSPESLDLTLRTTSLGVGCSNFNMPTHHLGIVLNFKFWQSYIYICVCVCVHACMQSCFSHVQLFVTL